MLINQGGVKILMQPHVIWYPAWALFGFFFVLRRRLLRDQVLHTSRMPRTAANGKNREYDISCYQWALGLIVFHFMNWFVRLLCFISLKYIFMSIANSSAFHQSESGRSQGAGLRDCLEDLISILQKQSLMVMEGTGLSHHLQTYSLPIPQTWLSWNPKPVPFRWFRTV